MIEVTAVLIRTLQLLSGCALLGLLTFALLRRSVGLQATPLYRSMLVLAATFLIAGVGVLASQATVVTGTYNGIVDPQVWQQILSETRFGKIWRWREGLMLAAFGSLLIRVAFPRLPQETRHLALTGLAALAGLTLSAASTHAAASDPAWVLVGCHAIHLAAVSIWMGGLFPVILELRRSANNYSLGPAAACLFTQFARLAAVMTGLIVVSGAVLAVAHVGSFPALLGTPYGLWLTLKLTLVGVAWLLAARLQWSFLASFSNMPPGLAAQRTWRLVAVEFAFAALAFLSACVLSALPPARHENISWWLPFRFAPEVTWTLPGVGLQAGAGAVLLAGGCWMFLLRRHAPNALLIGSLVLLSAGLAVGLPPLMVPAFPDTYRTSPVSYNTTSIDGGAELFRQHCSACHGASGVGDGPALPTLRARPADLTAGRPSDHTAGDIYWWISQGVPEGMMPGFAQKLTEEERWDVVNYLRALGHGYQARDIRPTIVTGKRWLLAPDFNYATQFGVGGALKEFRGKRPMMLVLFSWPQSKPRLEWLDDNRGAILDSGAEFIAVPMSEISDKELHSIRVPLALQGAQEIVHTYMLFRRTTKDVDRGDKGEWPNHVEFLIDRAGYVRARWLPSEGDEWGDANVIANQIQRLNSEDDDVLPPNEQIR
jgi:putative copper resistance protein D